MGWDGLGPAWHSLFTHFIFSVTCTSWAQHPHEQMTKPSATLPERVKQGDEDSPAPKSHSCLLQE